MPIVVIEYFVKENFKKEVIKEKLQWYDIFKKEILEFEGTKLDFEYKQDPYLVALGEEGRKKVGAKSTYRLLPKVCDIECVNYNKKEVKKNDKEIMKFFMNYLNYNNSNIFIEAETDSEISFNVPDNEVDDFIYQAHRNGYTVHE